MKQARQPRWARPTEESPDTAGQGGRVSDPGKPAGKCHRNTPPMARAQLTRAQVRVKWCGKSAPASRRRGGWANPTRCKGKQERSQVARRAPGRPLRWMAAKRQDPAYRPAKGGAPERPGPLLRVVALEAELAADVAGDLPTVLADELLRVDAEALEQVGMLVGVDLIGQLVLRLRCLVVLPAVTQQRQDLVLGNLHPRPLPGAPTPRRTSRARAANVAPPHAPAPGHIQAARASPADARACAGGVRALRR